MRCRGHVHLAGLINMCTFSVPSCGTPWPGLAEWSEEVTETFIVNAFVGPPSAPKELRLWSGFAGLLAVLIMTPWHGSATFGVNSALPSQALPIFLGPLADLRKPVRTIFASMRFGKRSPLKQARGSGFCWLCCSSAQARALQCVLRRYRVRLVIATRLHDLHPI